MYLFSQSFIKLEFSQTLGETYRPFPYYFFWLWGYTMITWLHVCLLSWTVGLIDYVFFLDFIFLITNWKFFSFRQESCEEEEHVISLLLQCKIQKGQQKHKEKLWWGRFCIVVSCQSMICIWGYFHFLSLRFRKLSICEKAWKKDQLRPLERFYPFVDH